MKGWLIRAQQPRSKRISCKGYPPPPPRELWSYVRAGGAPPELTRSFCILQSCPVDFHSTYNSGIGIGDTRTPPLPRRRELLSYVRASCAPPPCSGPMFDLTPPSPPLGLYTILVLPILYGVYHTNVRSEGESYTVQLSCTGFAPGWAMQVGGGNERMVDSCTTASK